jgi:hypothetical protein
MAGLYAAQARVLIELRGRYPDDDTTTRTIWTRPGPPESPNSHRT